jgi:uncharacterized phiE125 gp8 family phage protein
MIKVTGTPIEPISLSDAKLHIRVDNNTEDTLILSLITSAREYCENYTGRSFADKTLEYYIDFFPAEISLPKKPVKSVTSIIYKDYEGAEVTLIENTDYLVDLIQSIIVPAYGKSWPSFNAYPVNPIKITYLTGDATSVPGAVKTAMLLLIGHWYENRGAVLIGSLSKEIEFSVRSLLDQYRDRWWD